MPLYRRLLDDDGGVCHEWIRSHCQGIEMRILSFQVYQVVQPLSCQQRVYPVDIVTQMFEVTLRE